MSPLHLVLADRDYDYVSHFARWFAENKSGQFRVSVFTEPESFRKFISESDEKIDFILAAEDFLTNTEVKNVTTAVLGYNTKLENLPAIKKYQPAPVIYSEIQSVLSENSAETGYMYTPGRSELVVCFSPSIFLRSAFALLLTVLSENHVYISLESFPFIAMDVNSSSCGKNLSDIFYYIKSRKGNPVMALESAVVSNGNMNFIPPLDNPSDLWELTNEEIQVFIEALRSWGNFSKIIINSDCNTGPATMKFLENASYIMVPFNKKHMHQVPRLKNMINRIPGSGGKVIWIFCGNDDGILIPDIENCHIISWIDESILSYTDNINLDPPRMNQLENLFSKHGNEI